MIQKPLILDGGRIKRLPSGDELEGSDNFSYFEVSHPTKIESGEQMFLTEESVVVEDELIIEGQAILEQQLVIPPFPPFPPLPDENFSFFEVLDELTVPSGQQMVLVGKSVITEDELIIEGCVFLDDMKETVVPPPPVYAENFSYHTVQSGLAVTVPADQQMLLDGDMIVEGQMVVEGQFVLIDEPEGQFVDPGLYAPLFEIQAGELVRIAERREYWLSDSLILDGILQVEGRLLIGA